METSTAAIRPLHDRILIKRVEAESKTPGGLFIPDNAKERPIEGLVTDGSGCGVKLIEAAASGLGTWHRALHRHEGPPVPPQQ